MPRSQYSYKNIFTEDTEESFYWAGFLAADGCVLDKTINGKVYLTCLRLSLSKKDEGHILKFKKCLQTDAEIKTATVKMAHLNKEWNDVESSTISIYSVDICRSLGRFNVTPRKTHIYEFPERLTENVNVRHFMRGYFDGDGCIWVDKKGNLNFELRGTKQFLEVYQELLVSCCNVKRNRIKLSCGICRLRYHGNRVCNRIYKYLYGNSRIYLDRKLSFLENNQ